MTLYIIILVLSNILFAPLSAMILWQRYTNFTDGFSHAAIMSVVITSFLKVNLVLGSMINGLILIILIYLLKSNNDNNLTITISSFFLMCLAMLLSDVMGISLNMRQILFGNIYSVNINMIPPILMMILLSYIFMYYYWKDFILVSLNKDLALSRNINVKKMEFIFLTLVVLTIGVCMKFMGTIVMFGILVIPPTIARLISHSPKIMVFYTGIVGILSSITSLVIWTQYKVSVVPLILCINFIFFVLVKLYQYINSRFSSWTSKS